jgi:hypothetical protein
MHKWTLTALAGIALALANGCSGSPEESSEHASDDLLGPLQTCSPRRWFVNDFESLASQLCGQKLYATPAKVTSSYYVSTCDTSKSAYGPCPADGFANEWQNPYDLVRCYANQSPYYATVDTSGYCGSVPTGSMTVRWDPGCGSSCM